MKKYHILHSKDHLISIEAIDGAKHTQYVNENLVDNILRAYSNLKEQYGINYVVSTQELQQQTGCAPSTFNSNICGGTNGLLSQIEKVVYLRFLEAVNNTGPDLEKNFVLGLRHL